MSVQYWNIFEASRCITYQATVWLLVSTRLCTNHYALSLPFKKTQSTIAFINVTCFFLLFWSKSFKISFIYINFHCKNWNFEKQTLKNVFVKTLWWKMYFDCIFAFIVKSNVWNNKCYICDHLKYCFTFY